MSHADRSAGESDSAVPPESEPEADATSTDPVPDATSTDPVPDATSTDPELGETIAKLTAEDLEPGQRNRLLGRLIGQVRARGVGDLFKPRAAVKWIADAVGDIAPYVPVRDLETLRRHHPGLEGDRLADRLVRNASRASAGVGAAGGGVAAIEWAATPTLLSAPVLLAAETVTVVAIEIKLIGELHEVYGQPVPGNGAQRAIPLVMAWSQQRGVNPMVPGVGIGVVLGTAARREMRDRLLRRLGRNLTTLGPFLTGAAVASYLNRRATKSIGDQVIADLKKRQRKIIDGEAG